MAAPTIDVDTASYESASDTFYDVDVAVADAVAQACSSADGAGGMAGCDSSGVEWAQAYDTAAQQALDAGKQLVGTLGHLGDLLGATGANHARADTASTPAGGPTAADPVIPKHAADVTVNTPPSANGTPGGEPDGWGLVAHLLSWVWPNGHQDQLRAVGSGWRAAGQALGVASYRVYDAITVVERQKSPEVEAAVTACNDARIATAELGDAYRGIGQACEDYAAHLDEAHREIVDELRSLVEWTIAIEAGGAALALFTAGISEGAAQAAEATRCGVTAGRIGAVLSKLAELARAVVTAIRGFVTTIGEAVAKLVPLGRAPVEAAVEEVGEVLTKGLSEAEARAAYEGMSGGGGHATRHFVEDGVIPNKGSLASRVAQFREMTQPILQAPLKRWPWKVNGTLCEAYYGEVDGHKVVLFIAQEGPYTGKVLTSVLPRPNQIAMWGLE